MHLGLDQQHVPRLLFHHRRDGKEIHRQAQFGETLFDGPNDLVLAQLLAGEVREVLAFVQELEQRRLASETDAADHVVDIVAIQAAGGRQQDVIVAAYFQLVAFEHVGRRLCRALRPE